jgi:RNA recognition motif-containing protein
LLASDHDAAHGFQSEVLEIIGTQSCRNSCLASRVMTSMTTIYVGNLPFSATETDVRSAFEQHGAVQSVKLVNDRETGRPRGFGFVEMAPSEAQTAIQHMNGFQMGGRPLRVNEAREREARPPRQNSRW